MIYSKQGVPEEHKNSTYDSFDWTNKEQLREILLQFVSGEREKGLVLIGKPGVGKSHLMVGTYFELQEKGIFPGSGVVYFDYQNLLNYLRDGFQLKIRGDAAIESLCMVRYLIIDDIKPEPRGEFWKEILEQIFEYCYNNQTKILLSTNADDSDELISRWGLMDYHVSRLTHMADVIALQGEDYRAK